MMWIPRILKPPSRSKKKEESKGDIVFTIKGSDLVGVLKRTNGRKRFGDDPQEAGIRQNTSRP